MLLNSRKGSWRLAAPWIEFLLSDVGLRIGTTNVLNYLFSLASTLGEELKRIDEMEIRIMIAANASFKSYQELQRERNRLA